MNKMGIHLNENELILKAECKVRSWYSFKDLLEFKA